MPLGIARAVSAIVFSIIIGLCMHFLFGKKESRNAAMNAAFNAPEASCPLWQNGVFYGLMVAILVFANWGKPIETGGF